MKILVQSRGSDHTQDKAGWKISVAMLCLRCEYYRACFLLCSAALRADDTNGLTKGDNLVRCAGTSTAARRPAEMEEH